MKLIINKIFLLLCVVCCASCNYLDIVPDEKATEEDAFKNPQSVERYLYSCYAYIPNPRSGSSSIDWMTGDDVVTPWEHEDFGSFAQGIYTPSRPVINNWNDMYKGIRQCYLLKANVGSVSGLSQDMIDAYQAEADFLIAYYHFLLVRAYGPIILIKEPVDINDLENPENFLPRIPYDECVSWIAESLRTVASRLPGRRTGADYGRATSTAAMAIRARLLLYAASPQFNGGEMFKNIYANFKNPDGTPLISTDYNVQKWKNAAEACKIAIDLAREEQYDLYQATANTFINLPEPKDLNQRTLRFTFVDGDNTPEVIWAFCTKEGDNFSLHGKSLPRWNYTFGGLSPTLRQVERFYTKNGLPIDEDPAYPYPTRHDIVDIPAGDLNGEGKTLQLHLLREPRFYAWISYHNGYYEVMGKDEASGSTNAYASKWKRGDYKALIQYTKTANMGVTSENKNGTKTGYLNKKGTHPGSSVTSSGLKISEYPWPMIRLGELYLNYAEACIEAGDLGEGKKYLNFIRTRAGIPAVEKSWGDIGVALDQDKLRKIVRQERQIELYLENHNFWDLRRWGIAETLGEKPKGLSVSQTDLALFAQPTEVAVNRRFVPAQYLMPIPIEEVNRNPNLAQNPGYETIE